MKITASKVIQWVYAIYVTIINAVCTALWIVNDAFVWTDYWVYLFLCAFLYTLLTIPFLFSLFDEKVGAKLWVYYSISYTILFVSLLKTVQIGAGV